MHELSIARAVVSQVVQEAEMREMNVVSLVVLRVGRLSGIQAGALKFGFEFAVMGTPLEGSQLEIEEVDVTLFCGMCEEIRPLVGPNDFRCQQCGTPSANIASGRELEIRSFVGSSESTLEVAKGT